MRPHNQMRIASGLSSFFLSEEECRVRKGDGEQNVSVVRGSETVEDLDLSERRSAERSELLDLAAESSGDIDIVRSGNIGLLSER